MMTSNISNSSSRSLVASILLLASAWLACTWAVASTAPGAYVLPVVSMAVMGLLLPALAIGLLRRTAESTGAAPDGRPWLSLAVVLGYLVVFALVVLGWGFGALDRALPAGRAHEIIALAIKLVSMVVAPLGLIALMSRAPWPPWRARRALPPPDRRTAVGTAVLAVLCIGVTAVALPSLAQIRALQPSAFTLAWATPACLGFVAIAAGFTEEVLFRVVLQTRIAAVLRSNGGAIALASLAFALAHVPGLYLRGDAAAVGITRPSLGWTIAYAISVLAPPGVFFGVLWARTRNLLVVVIVHAAIDLLPNLADFLRVWAG